MKYPLMQSVFLHQGVFYHCPFYWTCSQRRPGFFSVVERPAKEGDNLGPGAGCVGGEGGFTGAVGDALFHGPGYGCCIRRAAGHVGEVRLDIGIRAAQGAPQVFHDRRPGTRTAGLQSRSVGNAHDARPPNRLALIDVLVYITEGHFAFGHRAIQGPPEEAVDLGRCVLHGIIPPDSGAGGGWI